MGEPVRDQATEGETYDLRLGFAVCGMVDVYVVPLLSDNYGYVVVEPESGDCVVVDGAEPEKIVAKVTEVGANVVGVLSTHHHWDHAGGNSVLVETYGVPVYGGDERVEAITEVVEGGKSVDCGEGLVFGVLATPCHTAGHVVYTIPVGRVVGGWSESEAVEGRPLGLFSGDTLFVGGCGKFFEGGEEGGALMDAALNGEGAIGGLGDDTLVLCGHEYTVSNLVFAEAFDPEREAIAAKLAWARSMREEGKPTIPSTLGEERTYNPFMLIAEYGGRVEGGRGDVMAFVRGSKNEFRP